MNRFAMPVMVAMVLALSTAGCAARNGGTAVAVPVTVTVSVPVTVTVGGDAGTDGRNQPTGSINVPGSAADTSIPPLPSEGTDVDPCKLVVQLEAEKLAATKLNPADKSGQTCTYTGPVDGPTAQVQVFVGPGAQKQLGLEKQLGHPLRKLAGVGTESWAAESAVYVSKGALWTSVDLVLLNDPSENVTRLEQVARIVASRL